MAKEVFNANVGAGSWRVIVDGDNIGSTTMSGTWSGAVENKVEFRRLDVADSTTTPENPPAP